MHRIAALKSTVEAHRKIIAFLLTNKANINAKLIKDKHFDGFIGLSPLFMAAINGNIDIATILLENGANCNISSKHHKCTFLHILVEEGYYDLIALALKNRYLRAKIDYQEEENGRSALYEAVLRQKYGIAKLLIDHGANVNRCHRDDPLLVFVTALDKNDVRMAKLLIENGLDLDAKNENGMTPLFGAVMFRKYEIAELLIKKGANVMVRVGKDKITPLHQCMSMGGDDLTGNFLMMLLLKHGADVNAKLADGETPLHAAARSGHGYRTQILIQMDSNVDAVMEYEMTPLHWASDQGHLKIVELLVEAGADINAKNLTDWTPLHLAVKENHLKIVEYLVKKGARQDLRDKMNNLTPIEFAKARGNNAIIDVLAKKSASDELNLSRLQIK